MVSQTHLFMTSVDVPGRRTRPWAAAEIVLAALLLYSLAWTLTKSVGEKAW